jgi:dephospho-CoA kinase
MIIGITGGIGSGKTFICKKFKEYGVPVYNADERAKFLMENDTQLKNELISYFGKEIYLNEKLNKQLLAKRIFTNKKDLEFINSVVHPAVAKDTEIWEEENKDKSYLIKEAALLFENKSYKELDKTILVFAPEDERILRVMKRDSSSKDQVLSRINNQMSDLDKMENADFIINNTGKNQIDKIVMKMNMLFSMQNN